MTKPTSDSVVIVGVFVAVIIILVYCARLLQSQTQWLKALDVRVEIRDKRWEDAIIRTEELNIESWNPAEARPLAREHK